MDLKVKAASSTCDKPDYVSRTRQYQSRSNRAKAVPFYDYFTLQFWDLREYANLFERACVIFYIVGSNRRNQPSWNQYLKDVKEAGLLIESKITIGTPIPVTREPDYDGRIGGGYGREPV